MLLDKELTKMQTCHCLIPIHNRFDTGGVIMKSISLDQNRIHDMALTVSCIKFENLNSECKNGPSQCHGVSCA